MKDYQPKASEYRSFIVDIERAIQRNKLSLSDRKLAMEWWNNMSDKEKSLITYHNFENRSYESLTGLEIEKLWNLEFKK